MNEVDEKSLAYVAGFFDGEGCACICGNYSIRIMISQKLPQVLYWIKGMFGGEVYLETKSQNSAKWGVYNKKDASKFLLSIRPYLRVKLIDVDFCVRMLEVSSDNYNRPQAKNGLFKKNPHAVERRKIYDEYKHYRRNCYKQKNIVE